MYSIAEITKHHEAILSTSQWLSIQNTIITDFGKGDLGPSYSILFGYHTTDNSQGYPGHAVLHHENGPAVLVFSHSNHKLLKEMYYVNGRLHRTDGPAVSLYDQNGRVYSYEYAINGLNHREDGPATKDVRGLTYWRLNGVQVNSQIVMKPETLTRRQVMRMQNMEMRRVAIERMGIGKFLDGMSEDHVIDSRIDPITNIEEKLVFLFNGLRDTNMIIEKVPIHALICFCPSTARSYTVRIPANVKTCEEAQAWLLGPRLQKVKLIGAS